MHLSELLEDIDNVKTAYDPLITGLCQDSRQLKPGNLFFAYPGVQQDGRDFIKDAIAKGASAVLLEASETMMLPSASIPIIPVAHLTSFLGLIAARFYGHPSQQLSVVGITGTNGKTSCTHFLAQCLQQQGQSCGVMGTLGNGIYPHLKAGLLTTPDAIELQQCLAEFLTQKVNTVAMEVSSHRLAQQRLNAMTFAIAAFTNLSRDHLDYHRNMAAYARAKRSFFSLPGVQQVVLNVDDAYGQRWLSELAGRLPVTAYAINKPEVILTSVPYVTVKNYECNQRGLQADIATPWGDLSIENPFLIGRFNLSNLLLLIVILKLLGFALSDIAKAVASIKAVPGRMEVFYKADKPLVVVDYAHTPDALQQALQALRNHCQGDLYCVFGCGGDRDKGKRALMATVAEQYADYLVMTNDNPRNEDPAQIIQAMQQGLSGIKPVYVEQDRRLALSFAIQKAKRGDIILLAGKGHEAYQLVAGVKYPFSDAKEVRSLLGLDKV